LAEQIALASGNTGAAAGIGFERQTREFRRQLTARGDTGALNDIAGLGQQAVLQGQLTDKTREYSNTLDALGIKQGRLDLLISTGNVSEIDALVKKADLAKEYIGILTAEVDAQRAVAEALTGPARDAALLQIEKERLAIEQLKVSANGLKDKFDNIFSDNFTTFLDDIVNHTKSVKNAFLDMGRGIEQAITHLVDEQIAKTLFNSLFGAGGATGGVSPGGILSGLFGTAGAGLAGLFGSSAAGSGAGAAADIGASDLAELGIGFAASGTDYARGGPTLVGERGPEIINLPKGARVTSNAELMARRGAKSIVVSQTINVLPGASRQTADQAALEAARAASRALGRNG
jgi:hypothetical protein